MNQGKFIVIEGADGVGKSVVSALLSEWLTKQGITNIVTRHPGSTHIGADIRKIVKQSNGITPIAEGLLLAADNNQFIETVLRPALDKGTWVIGDRNNFISSIIYQIMSGASFDDLDKIHAATIDISNPIIDVLFILRAEKRSREIRKLIKNDTHYGSERGQPDKFEDNSEYADGVARAYERLMEEQADRLLKFVHKTVTTPDPSPRAFYINADRPVGDVLDDIVATINALFIETADNN